MFIPLLISTYLWAAQGEIVQTALPHLRDLSRLNPTQVTSTSTLKQTAGKPSRLSIFNNPYQYSGEYRDNESNLDYLNARYYDANTMRFTSRDTYDLLNLYAYANGDPIMNKDPSGHTPQWLSFGLNVIGSIAGIANFKYGESHRLFSFEALGAIAFAIGVVGITIGTVAPQHNGDLHQEMSLYAGFASSILNVVPVMILGGEFVLERGSSFIGTVQARLARTEGEVQMLAEAQAREAAYAREMRNWRNYDFEGYHGNSYHWKTGLNRAGLNKQGGTEPLAFNIRGSFNANGFNEQGIDAYGFSWNGNDTSQQDDAALNEIGRTMHQQQAQ